MNTSTLRRFLLLFGIGASVASTNFASAAQAADASASESSWASEAHSAIRLIAGSVVTKPGQPLRAGVELKLAPGWKTYWRYPGDSGVPPRFDFSHSDNVALVTVSWPAPQRFVDAGGITIGYKNGVIWPITVEPKVAGEPVQLRLKLDYALCEKQCVPAEAAVELTLGSGTSAYDSVLAEALRSVPRRAAPREGSPAILAARRETNGGRPRVTVDIAAPPGEAIDLFVEGPSPEWALPLPAPEPAAPGMRRFSFDVDGLPPGATISGAELRFTLIAPGGATEVTMRVD